MIPQDCTFVSRTVRFRYGSRAPKQITIEVIGRIYDDGSRFKPAVYFKVPDGGVSLQLLDEIRAMAAQACEEINAQLDSIQKAREV